jgi:sodium transport system permease protein
MKFRKIYGIVLRKELRELLRDKRSLFWLLAPPIILPGLGICAGLFIGAQAVRIADKGFPILIENVDRAPELAQRFEDDDATYLVEPPADSQDDAFGDAMIIVSIPEGFQDQIDSGETVSVQMITRDNSVVSFLAQGAAQSVINNYSDELLNRRLESQGLNHDWLTPIRINETKRSDSTTVGSSDDEEDGGSNILATIFLPLAVTSWLVGGGIGLILDTTVGEKERQTIENLLVTPASRTGIVLGKLSVVFIASIVVMGLWLTEGLVLNSLSNAGPKLMEADSLSPTKTIDILLHSGGNVVELVFVLLILIIPFIVMLNGLVMAWCARAANYREGNLFMVLLQLGLPATILLTIFSLPATVGGPIYAIPFLGTIIAIRDLFSNALPTTGLIINVTSGLIYAVGSIMIAAWVFNKEWALARGLQ